MISEKKIVCIGCPAGCLVRINLGINGEITETSGNRCRKGQEFVVSEFLNPVRVLTTTVLTEGCQRRLLSVRTDRPISKEKIRNIMQVTAGIKVKPPINMGQEIAHDVLGTGVNLISTGTC